MPMKRIVRVGLTLILALALGGSGVAWAVSNPVLVPPLPVQVALTLRPDRSQVAPGESVLFFLVLENTSNQTVQLSFSSGQQYDLEVRGPNGYFWRWSKDRAFIEIFITMTLEPGEKKELQETWSVPQGAASGTYSVVAWITAQEVQPTATANLQVSSSILPGSPQMVFLADSQGGVLLAITERADLLKTFGQMLAEGTALWVGGKLENADNAPWSFRFQPDTMTAVDATMIGAQAPSFAAIEGDLSAWLGMSQAYVNCQVLGIDPLPFPDIEGSWAFYAILALAQQKVVNGYPDGTFRQERLITRAEFAKMIAIAYNLPIAHPASQTFPDVPPSHWAYDVIAAAAQAKLVQGYPNGNFGPEDPVSKEQVIAVLVRQVGWMLSQPASPTFQDLPPVEWAYPYVETAVEEGLFLPQDPNLAGDLFLGNAPATRSQISVLVARLLAQYTRRADLAIIAADHGGGLAPIEFFRQHVPAFHLYGDGTVIALRGGSVRQASLNYSQGLDLITVLMAFGFLNMEDHYQPEPMPTDLGTTSIKLQASVFQKEVSEYAWGAPGAFHFLYSYLRNFPLPLSQEYIPAQSTLFVNLIGPVGSLTEDQNARLVKLAANFTDNAPTLAELSKMADGYTLNANLYSALAPSLAAHERIIVAVENGQAYTLIVKIELPQTLTSGVFGTITLGPLQPVSKPGEVNERPYQATVLVMSPDGLWEITHFQSDAEGRFRVPLAPGDYLLEPTFEGEIYPRAEKQMVTVPQDQFVEVNIRYDMGIR
jgi:hypothetical protein